MSQALTTQISLMHFKQCTHTVHSIVYWRQTSHNMGGKFYGVDLRGVPKPILAQTLPRQEKEEGSSRSCFSQSSTTPLLSSPFFWLRRRDPEPIPTWTLQLPRKEDYWNPPSSSPSSLSSPLLTPIQPRLCPDIANSQFPQPTCS